MMCSSEGGSACSIDRGGSQVFRKTSPHEGGEGVADAYFYNGQHVTAGPANGRRDENTIHLWPTSTAALPAAKPSENYAADEAVWANIESHQGSGYFPNATITAPPSSFPTPIANGSAVQNDCCFLVQDTVTDHYWANYTTSTWYGLRSITSIITSVTQYADTAITNYETTTTIENSSYLLTSQIGIDNVGTHNNGYGPYTTAFVINATATSMYGTILTSPAGFYVIPTVKVIRVPAVTQANGQLACTTRSTWSLFCQDIAATTSPRPSGLQTTVEFTGMNNHMQAYYSGQQGPSLLSAEYEGGLAVTPWRAPTNTTGYPSTTIISFSTPYIYLPPRAATEAVFFNSGFQFIAATISRAVTTSSTLSLTTTVPLTSTLTTTVPLTSTVIYSDSSPVPVPVYTVNVDYGFIPPDVIPWMLQNSDYANQYPELKSCLPGGPSIVPNIYCSTAAPAFAEAVPDLTASSATTVQGMGCFHPGNCPATAATIKAPEPALSAAAIQASSTTFPGDAFPNTNPTAATLLEHSKGQSKVSTVNLMSVIAPIPVVPTSDAQSTALAPSSQPAPSQQRQQPEQSKASTAESNPMSIAAHVPGPSSSETKIPVPSAPNQPAPSQPIQQSQKAKTSTVEVNPMSVIAPIPLVFTSNAQSTAPSQSKQPLPSQQTQQSEYQTSNSDSGPGPISQTVNSVNAAAPLKNSSPISTPFPVSMKPVHSVQSPGQSYSLQSASSLPVIIIASSTLIADSSSNFVLESHTIIPGGSPTIISSSTFSLAPSANALIINGATSILQTPPSSPSPSLASPPNLASIIAGAFNGHPAITELSQTISADSLSQFVIGSQTLAPGSSPLTISGSTFSLAPSASAIIVNGVTSALFVTPNPIAPAAPTLTINSQPLTPNSASAYIISSQTLAPGSSPITVAGTTYSLFPSASAILINGHPSLLSHPPTLPVLTLPSSLLLTATPTSLPVYILASQTLLPGGAPITISSTPISLAPSASALIVGTSTQTLASGSVPILTLGSQTLTASTASAQAYIAGGQTLVPGGAAATISGVEVSIAPGGTAAVVGGVTEGFVASGGVGGNGNGSAYAGPGFVGAASRGGGGAWGWGWGWEWVVGVGVGVLGWVML